MKGLPLPPVIPPRSLVTLMRADPRTPAWQGEVGRQFRVGYYRRADGLDCIWLVNDGGEYEQTTDPETLLAHFLIDELSDETDLYGDRSQTLERLPKRSASVA